MYLFIIKFVLISISLFLNDLKCYERNQQNCVFLWIVFIDDILFEVIKYIVNIVVFWWNEI